MDTPICPMCGTQEVYWLGDDEYWECGPYGHRFSDGEGMPEGWDGAW